MTADKMERSSSRGGNLEIFGTEQGMRWEECMTGASQCRDVEGGMDTEGGRER